MAPKVKAAVTRQAEGARWLVHIDGVAEARDFETEEEAEAFAREIAWTRSGRQEALRLLKKQPVRRPEQRRARRLT